MRQINNFKDCNIVVKQLQDQITQLLTKDINMHMNRVRNASPAIQNGDYVTFEQLPTVTLPPPPDNQHFAIVFSSIGPVVVGQLCAPYAVASNRVGTPTQVVIAASVAPTVNATFNATFNGQPLLTQDVVLPAGSNGPVTSTMFVNPVPFFGQGVLVVPTVTAAGGASFVSLTIQVQRLVSGN